MRIAAFGVAGDPADPPARAWPAKGGEAARLAAGGGRGGGPRWGRARGGAAQRGPWGLPALWPSVAFPLLRGCRFVFKVTLCARVIAHR